jgi:carbon starvation protein
MIVAVVLISVVILALGYRFYGAFLTRRLGLDDSRPTPACAINDGLDYVPARKSMLLAQHFSAIAAAGPIVGPILAGIWFGWLPALIWIVLGSIFIGGTHDFTSLVASVRHKATSIGELSRQYMSRTSQIIYLVFVWFALVYVIIAFTDITAQTFKTVSADDALGPGVAVSSFLYLFLGIGLGIALRKTRVKLWMATAIAIPILGVFIWWGTALPPSWSSALLSMPLKTWEVILLVYCFAASLLPMWLLLQPRGYLGGWFLYLTMATALFGALFGGFGVRYPALNLEGLHSAANGQLLFPIVFITVACGACSGFHAIVSAGTTSKQIAKESDTRPVAYGSMLLEAVVAILALATVMMLAKGDPLLKSDPNFIFAKGISGYLSIAGVGAQIGLTFALLAFSTFVYDTLDVCTRLARYILQELFGWKSMAGAFAATFITLALPLVFLMLTKEKGYLVAWPIFGSSNQLLASLTLLAVSIWLMKTGKRAVYAVIPMVFMLVFASWSLVLQVKPFVAALPAIAHGTMPSPVVMISGVCGVILLALTAWLMVESVRVLSAARGKRVRAFGLQRSEP